MSAYDGHERKDAVSEEMFQQAEFIAKHGENTTDRMVPDLLRAILKTLVEHGIIYDDRKLEIKPLGDGIGGDDYGVRLVFDVKQPNNIFDHVEFCLRKSGWGRGFFEPKPHNAAPMED